jgi:hypothetical protein
MAALLAGARYESKYFAAMIGLVNTVDNMQTQ